jgi:hypothetical protein
MPLSFVAQERPLGMLFQQTTNGFEIGWYQR